MTLLSRQVHRTFFSPSVLTSAERRWIRGVNIVGALVIAILMAVTVLSVIVMLNRDVAQWLMENLLSGPWYHDMEVWWQSITPWNRG